ncbi:MAG: ribosome biogenesis GTP-binding protein YihA/YsxC [Bacteroidota bacterium]|nr:ribosome biogenesis GTP-binding protein YihA/YsxC [Bacteroidota bacterium]
MNIKEARFISSSPDLKGCPPPKLPEFAFIGRSNVGKSSLINMLAMHGNLAKISSTPGKTKLINHFLINQNWYLVDLPGYGYAKVSKNQRSEFRQTILNYISKRDTLYCLYVLIDSRIPPQAIDLKFVNWLGENQVPFVVVFTKTDKLAQAEWHRNVDLFKDKLAEVWDELPPMIFSSSVKKTGRDDILTSIGQAMESAG